MASNNARRGFQNSPPAQRPSSPDPEIRYFGNFAKGSLATLIIGHIILSRILEVL